MRRKLSLIELVAIVATAAVACWFGRTAANAYRDYRSPHRIVVTGRE
jgi:hypothetical protein